MRIAAAFDIVAALLSAGWQDRALVTGAVLLLVAVLLSACIVYRITIRFVYFIDDPHPKHWPGIRQFRAWRRRSKVEPTYSHHPLPISSDLNEKIAKVLKDISADGCEHREELGRRSLAVAVEHQGQGNKLLAQLAAIFIKQGHSVQYLTASRHPIEFVRYLNSELEQSGENWISIAKQIVAIDAYTPHFGFIDSIYQIRTRELRALGVTCINSKRTYAGIHTASSRAFKTIRDQLKQGERKPTLVIYEDCYALTDLESPEQYRIVVRHVLPSERMWDSMFTVFIESAQPESDWRMLHAFASMKLDLRNKDKIDIASVPLSGGGARK